jgi:hypothetical protein
LGDALDLNDRTINPLIYRNVLIAKESYQRPFQLRKRYVVNRKGFLETHIGDEKFYKLPPSLDTKCKTLEELLKERGKRILKRTKDEAKEILDDIRDWYREATK